MCVCVFVGGGGGGGLFVFGFMLMDNTQIQPPNYTNLISIGFCWGDTLGTKQTK